MKNQVRNLKTCIQFVLTVFLQVAAFIFPARQSEALLSGAEISLYSYAARFFWQFELSYLCGSINIHASAVEGTFSLPCCQTSSAKLSTYDSEPRRTKNKWTTAQQQKKSAIITLFRIKRFPTLYHLRRETKRKFRAFPVEGQSFRSLW